MKKTVLLTGGSGSIGEKTIEELIKQGDYNIRVFDLKNSNSKKVFRKYKNKLEIIWGNITNYKDVVKAVKGVDYIIHLAAIIPPLADEKPKLAEAVNLGGTKNILKAMKEVSKDAFLIFSSSISVYGDRVKDYLIKVTDKLKPSVGDYYAHTKIAAEKAIVESGVNYTIFRLTGVMGHPKVNPLLFHMPLNTKFEIVTTRDVGYALAKSIKYKNKLNGKIFNLSGGDNCRVIYKDFLKKSLSIYGLNFDLIPKTAFARQNFHCGYYEDSNVLNDILHFQRDDIGKYFELMKKNTNGVTVFFSKLFNKIIVNSLINKSEPLNAFKNGDVMLIKRFYFTEYEDETLLEKGKELVKKINPLKKS